jgi:hypothetical protein
MPSQDSAAAAEMDLRRYFESGTYGHAGAVAQVLERLPNGEYAWLRSAEPVEEDEALYVPTQAGRDLVARWRVEKALLAASD